jgi:hypothetical protein
MNEFDLTIDLKKIKIESFNDILGKNRVINKGLSKYISH